jgi:hydroxyacylglutathione hydrolase
LSSRGPTVPTAGQKENDATGQRKINQKWQRQNEVGGNRRAQRQPAAQITIKRTGLGVLRAFPKQQLQGLVISGKRCCTHSGTNQARRFGGFGARGAQSPATVGANANRLGLVFGAFHGLKLRHWPGQCNPKLATRPKRRQRFIMNLEDHLGDIIRKARNMSNVSSGAASRAAGISESELAALDETGQIGNRPNFAALAKLAGLNPAKLESIANGWHPTEKDLSLWRELRVFTTAGEGMTVNCFLVWDEATRETALFDTGFDAKPVLDCIGENQLQLRHVFITHTHYDHVEGLPKIREAFPKARIHSGSKAAPVDQRNKPNEIVHLGGLRVTHRETPGHAEDGVTYIVGNWQEDAPHVAIVGDAIFAGSMGNGNGAWDLARQKVKEQILSLPAETLICPGHGPLTTVAEEKEHNPFF